MIRSVLSFAFALLALGATWPIAAKSSSASVQQSGLPCPGDRSDALDAGAPAAASSAAPSIDGAAANRPSNKAARQRWKVLLPGALKSDI